MSISTIVLAVLVGLGVHRMTKFAAANPATTMKVALWLRNVFIK